MCDLYFRWFINLVVFVVDIVDVLAASQLTIYIDKVFFLLHTQLSMEEK